MIYILNDMIYILNDMIRIFYTHVLYYIFITHTHTHMFSTVFARANGQQPVVLVALYTRAVATPAAVRPLVREPRAANLTGGAKVTARALTRARSQTHAASQTWKHYGSATTT